MNAAKSHRVNLFALLAPVMIQPTLMPAAMAQSQPSADGQAVEQVVVTGTRIRGTDAKLPAAVTVITAQDLDDRGFRNVFDALNNLAQNTGFTQGADFGNTFTPAANTISLRGLGPNHTLILVNGQRTTEYPIAYNGSVNFVNLANIPSAAIERIEILNGGASAIYGSDAIAGVVNIILKDRVEGLDVNLKAGTTERGGGGNGRFQLSGGKIFGKLSTVFAFEYDRAQPIWSENRGFMNSTTLEGEAPLSIWERTDVTLGSDIPPADNCASFSKIFRNSVVPFDSGGGTYCGSGKARPAYWTVQTGNESETLYGKAKYELSDNTRVFGAVLASWDRTWNNTRGPKWVSDQATTGYFFNQNTGDYESWSRRIAPEEIGGASRYDKFWHDFSSIAMTGIDGDIGPSTWKYEVTYSASVYVSRERVPHLLASVDNYFLGPQLGVDGAGVPIYAPDPTRFDAPLTSAQFGSLLGVSTSKDTTWMQNATASANGELFTLPAGPILAAVVAEWGTQGFSNHPDPQINQGVFFNTGTEDNASGSRQRYAAALEVKVPILSNFDARLATRLDDYSFSGRTEGRGTYNAELRYRPIESVQLHASYSTSFRAPDMNYIFQNKTLGYEAATTDYYQCALAQQPLATCQYANVSPGANFIQSGNRHLGFENGRSFDYGVVFTPNEHIELSVSYWNLRIDNEVSLIDSDLLLRIESQCRLGQLNPSSPECVDALTRVERNPPNAIFQPNAITNLIIDPINAAYERTDGIDAGARLRWNFDRYGNLVWTTNYTQVMSHYYQQAAGDVPIDLVRSFNNQNSPDFPNKVTSTLKWNLRSLTATVEVERFGSIINQGLTGFITPGSFVNLSAAYQVGNATVAVIVNNLFDTIKKDDTGGWPYYPVGYYSPAGRQGWIDFSYHLGD